MTPRLLLTPAADGKFPSQIEGESLVPATCYLEDLAPDGVRWLNDIWADVPRAIRVAAEAPRQAFALARAMLEVLDGTADDAQLPLTLDLANFFVEQTLERALRLKDSGWDKSWQTWPEIIAVDLPRCDTGGRFKVLQKSQPYQWLVLRRLIGAPDQLRHERVGILRSLRQRLSAARSLRQASTPPSQQTIFGAHLRDYARVFADLELTVADVPNLVQPYTWRTDNVRRAALARVIAEHLRAAMEALDLPMGNAENCGWIYAKLMPTARVENFHENQTRYARWFDRGQVSGFITETGQGRYDENMFFWAECNRRGLPSVVIQHGGQYGYDDKIPGFFTLDAGLPTHFVSWGWRRYSSTYDPSLQRAKIVPLPVPRLSRLLWSARVEGAFSGPKTLVVPLSKFRTLDNRIGGNATDGVVLSLRRFVADVINAVHTDFDRVILTHRSKNFATDVLNQLLSPLAAERVEVLSSQDAPLTSLLSHASAVLWDVTATGMFETLIANVPTVALMRLGRWAHDAAWAENMITEAGIGAYDAPTAIASLRRFVRHDREWHSARSHIHPIIETFAYPSIDYHGQWLKFMKEVFLTRKEDQH